MFAIRSARSENNTKYGNVLARTYANSDQIAGNASADFGHFPSLESLLDTPLFTHLNRRIGTRINLDQLAIEISRRIRVTMKTDQGKMVVRPIDLSLTDICIESAHAIVEHGARVDVTLSYDGIEVVLPAIAALQSGLYARSTFLFIGTEGDAQSCSRRDLGLIYHALEAELGSLIHQRIAYFALSAVCSLMFFSWMVT